MFRVRSEVSFLGGINITKALVEAGALPAEMDWRNVAIDLNNDCRVHLQTTIHLAPEQVQKIGAVLQYEFLVNAPET